jgi:hypothetical protein
MVEVLGKIIKERIDTIEQYCCEPMSKFANLLIRKGRPLTIDTYGYLSSNGIVIVINNRYYVDFMNARSIADFDDKLIDVSFTMKYCPFCQEEIYEASTNNRNRTPGF